LRCAVDGDGDDCCGRRDLSGGEGGERLREGRSDGLRCQQHAAFERFKTMGKCE
jgi:hypothetical protein